MKRRWIPKTETIALYTGRFFLFYKCNRIGVVYPTNGWDNRILQGCALQNDSVESGCEITSLFYAASRYAVILREQRDRRILTSILTIFFSALRPRGPILLSGDKRMQKRLSGACQAHRTFLPRNRKSQRGDQRQRCHLSRSAVHTAPRPQQKQGCNTQFVATQVAKRIPKGH